jgi:hypothetical protein
VVHRKSCATRTRAPTGLVRQPAPSSAKPQCGTRTDAHQVAEQADRQTGMGGTSCVCLLGAGPGAGAGAPLDAEGGGPAAA